MAGAVTEPLPLAARAAPLGWTDIDPCGGPLND